MDRALNIKHIQKSFKLGFLLRKKTILKNISLSVKKGEIFGYLGPNGAGKTTTIKCITGLIFPDSGTIDIFGYQHLSLKAKELTGFLPENPYFYDYLTAYEFLKFYSHLYKKKEKKRTILKLLELVGLEQSANLQLRKYSRGMIQRIGLAQTLIHNPALIFLDEPLSGLDPVGRKELRDIILQLKEKGKTIFLSSHILQDIEMICDRVAILIDGQIINQGAIHDLISEKILFTEVVFSGVEPNKLEGFGEFLSIYGGKIMLKIFEEDKTEQAIQLVHSMGGKIHSLIPRTETLESLFVNMVKQK